MAIARILITAGEPAGIGPEIVVKLAQLEHPCQLIVCANTSLLLETAKNLNLPLNCSDFEAKQPAKTHQPQHLYVIDVPLVSTVVAGQLDSKNSAYVIKTLEIAADMAQNHDVDAILTGPIHKGIINQFLQASSQDTFSGQASSQDTFSGQTFSGHTFSGHTFSGHTFSGHTFSGHTEFFAEKSNTEKVVMMLATEGLRVCLATTHLPLRQVADAISDDLLTQILTIIDDELQQKFAIKKPKILVCGLNPHAGEDGHLGMEEIEIINPCLEKLRNTLTSEIIGPIPADTAFKPDLLKKVDCVLAMYHDQGLPTLKHKGFGNAVNMTLGLPFIRTSVDHGTGLDIAGKNIADIGSMQYALQFTLDLIQRKKLSA